MHVKLAAVPPRRVESDDVAERSRREKWTSQNALKGLDGALIVISHDETFLRTIGIEREIAL
jgi:hypothetical protein